MKIQKERIWGLVLAICLMAAGTPTIAFGATKTIPSVSIRVGTDTQAGETLNETITLYTDTTATQSGTYAATSSDKYYVRDAEWTSSTRSEMKVGDEPKMKVYLDIDDSNYAFKGTYSSSNVTVKGGTFVSAKKTSYGDLEVTIKLSGIKGTYSAPSDATWRDSGYGRAVWTMDDDDDEGITSGYYDVYLYRGSTVVKKLEAYKGTSYNFYPYMTKKGTYRYKVRTVPYTESQKKYGEKSDWLESDEIYIDEEHVSDGSGQTDGNGQPAGGGIQVGWIQSGSTWYYRYPDGSYQKDSWLKLNNKWYLFDQEGRMLTGWQTKNGNTYLLQNDGSMVTGWVKAGDYWYYLNTASDGVEGAMHVGWLRNNNRTYYLNSNGAMAEGWGQVEGNWYYFYPGYGYMAVNTTIDTFYVDSNGIWRK
ncbi:MAG: N-acetylmuramoyl-L-alanine amidase family protein [Hungatella sp.]|nr:N-acetylmuramoyl-L-alanine amidase family protein [Hungatella sp.]